MWDALGYYRKFNKLKDKGYTFKNGGKKLESYQNGGYREKRTPVIDNTYVNTPVIKGGQWPPKSCLPELGCG